jgi:hypothetical protein
LPHRLVADRVRTCDGRYFPVPASDGQNRAAVCSSFCPARETKIFYGGSIDDASTESGKSYSDLPNAFRYRKEMVAGPDGLVVASGRIDKRTAVNVTPVSPSVRARFERVPVVATE